MTHDRNSNRKPMRACPVEGCKHDSLIRSWDGEYEIVTCPVHSLQYPVPPLDIPQLKMAEFLSFVKRKKIYNQGVVRDFVYTPYQWQRFAEEFVKQIQDRWMQADFDGEWILDW